MLMLIILFLLSKTQNSMFLLSLYQQETTKNYQNFLAKNLKDQLIGMNIKQKVRIKIRQKILDIFFEPNFVGVNKFFVLVYLNKSNDVKRFNARRYYLPKGTIKNYNVTINGKILYGKAIDSDIKRYGEIRKLTTGQGEDYTTGCLLDYGFIKNH